MSGVKGMKVGVRTKPNNRYSSDAERQAAKDERNRLNDLNPRRREKRKDAKLKKWYGISLDDYNRMWSEQGGRCFICGRHETEFQRPLCVDHSHSTGKVRKLLCGNCNRALGLVYDNVDILQTMIKYLNGY